MRPLSSWHTPSGLERTYPVLFIERRAQRPVASDVDRFCQWAEDSGAPSSLVVWDGMVEQEEYSEFLRYLTSRGRKVVLAGSCYAIPEKYVSKSSFVLAPPQLTTAELDEFAAFLGKFHPSLSKALLSSSASGRIDETFLVALYRLLPPTRSLIRAGVTLEVARAERVLARKANEPSSAGRPNTVLGSALFEAGLIPSQPLIPQTRREVGGEIVDSAQDLTGLVMVPGSVWPFRAAGTLGARSRRYRRNGIHPAVRGYRYF